MRWHQAALEEPRLSYLHEKRGLSLETLAQHLIGYDGRAFTIPIYAPGRHGRGRRLVSVKYRYWPGYWFKKANGREVSKRTITDGGSSLYPFPLPAGGVLLGGGELDVLLCRQHGLPAISTTCGANLPEHLVPALAGRRVAVAYDVGEEVQANLTVMRLRRQGGCEAWVVPLRERMTDDGDDLTDWFVKYGYTEIELLRLIKSASRACRDSR
jgi:hypothetical protein